MNKRIIATFAVLAIVSMSALALAASPRGGRGPAADPTLTPEKQAAVTKIIEAHRGKLLELREKIWAKHTELQALSASGKAEKGDIQAIIGEITKLRADMNAEREAIRTEIEKQTGLKGFGPGYHRGGYGYGGGYGACGADSGACPGGGYGGGMGGGMGGKGMGRGMGMGSGACPSGPCN